MNYVLTSIPDAFQKNLPIVPSLDCASVTRKEGSNPEGEEQVIGHEKIVVGDVVDWRRSF
jgi:hypothetical protein